MLIKYFCLILAIIPFLTSVLLHIYLLNLVNKVLCNFFLFVFFSFDFVIRKLSSIYLRALNERFSRIWVLNYHFAKLEELIRILSVGAGVVSLWNNYETKISDSGVDSHNFCSLFVWCSSLSG